MASNDNQCSEVSNDVDNGCGDRQARMGQANRYVELWALSRIRDFCKLSYLDKCQTWARGAPMQSHLYPSPYILEKRFRIVSLD